MEAHLVQDAPFVPRQVCYTTHEDCLDQHMLFWLRYTTDSPRPRPIIVVRAASDAEELVNGHMMPPGKLMTGLGLAERLAMTGAELPG